jgi:hypothetical protein
MNFGKNCGIRLIVNGRTNIFGTVLNSHTGDKLTLVTSENFIGKSITTNYLLLEPLNSAESFKSLLQYYALQVKIYIVDLESGETEFLMEGNASID